MNFKKVDKQISKIQNLLSNVREDGKVSKIERDLLKNYIQDLYTLVLPKGQATKEIPEPIEKIVVAEKEPEVQEKIVVATPSPRVKPQPIAPQVVIKPEPVEIPAPVQTVAPEPIVETVAQPILDQVPELKETFVAVAEKAKEPIAPPPAIPKPKPQTQASANVETPVENDSEDLWASLFDEKEILKKADKFTMLPVKDLTRSMGINEKVFTIQELFNGNHDLFNTTMHSLNEMKSFQEAAQFLKNGVAKDNDWISELKKRKAAQFVKIVVRRYL